MNIRTDQTKAMDKAVHDLQKTNLLAAQICVESHKNHEKRHDPTLQTVFIMMAQILQRYNNIMADEAVKKGGNIDGQSINSDNIIHDPANSSGRTTVQIHEIAETGTTTGSDDVQSPAKNKAKSRIRHSGRRNATE